MDSASSTQNEFSTKGDFEMCVFHINTDLSSIHTENRENKGCLPGWRLDCWLSSLILQCVRPYSPRVLTRMLERDLTHTC